jgi:hypothetical protein
MNQTLSAVTNCRWLGDFTADEQPADGPVYAGTVVRPSGPVLEFNVPDLELPTAPAFTVWLQDKRSVQVQGDLLKHIVNPVNPNDAGAYAIIRHSPQGEVMVAVFRVSEVVGIFHNRHPSRTQSA